MDALQASVEAARNHRPGNSKVSPLVSAPAKKAKASAGTSDRAAGRGATGGAKGAGDLSELSKSELAKKPPPSVSKDGPR